MEAGIKAGRLFKGHFNQSAFNFREVNQSLPPLESGAERVFQGTVSAHGQPKPILLIGLESMNRAVDGDVVAVELLPKSQWRGALEDVVDADGTSGLPPRHDMLTNRSPRGERRSGRVRGRGRHF